MAPNSASEKIVNPNEHLKIPQWVNEEYFQPILEQNVPNYRRIVHFQPIAATQPGENYTSVMVRVVMDIELQDGSITEMSYILKTTLEAGNEGAAIVDSMNLFPKEKQMYQTLLPKFDQLYKEAGLQVQLNAKCLHIDDTPERITLVFEDLRRKNFANMDRLKGMDMAHIKQVLHKLAELHAVSAVYYELNGAYDEMYDITFFCEKNRPFFEAMGKTREALYEKAMHQWDLDNIEHYIAQMPDPDKTFDEGIRLNQHDPNEFNVLNHGDSWINNIMFQHDEAGNISQMLFVDFQVGKWGTPAQDLWYMIITSAAEDIRIKEFDNFVHIYHDRLVECLKLLKYKKKIPTLKDLQIMMLKYGFWAIITVTGVLTVVLLPSEKDANIETMMKAGPESDEFQMRIFTNPYYVKAVSQLFPFFDHKGIFDI